MSVKILIMLLPIGLMGQTVSADLSNMMQRLDKLEQQNKQLAAEVESLRLELSAIKGGAVPDAGPSVAGPSTAERLDVHDSRIEELAQTKVESSQRVPISLTGMLLFNAFANGKNGASFTPYPLTAALNAGLRNSGATMRQTVLGLKFDGPGLVGGGKASGNVYMDFYGGSIDPSVGHLMRLRVATLDLAWKRTTVTVGQDKPIFAPREPTSLAQVGISPLTSAGNLWDWRPQARVEQRFELGANAGVKAQGGVYMTYENDINLPANIPGTTTAVLATLERWRPAYEGRLEFWTHSGERKFEIAPGFHFSSSHVSGASVPSTIASLDWKFQPGRQFAFTGAWFRGKNTANTGAMRQGFVVTGPATATAVHSWGGWGQSTFFLTPRLTWNLYGGQQRDRSADLGVNFFAGGGITRNFVYANNFMYRLAPNILASFEASQTRTNYRNSGIRLNNHYDLSLAYLF